MRNLLADSQTQPIKNWARDPSFYTDNVSGTSDGAFVTYGTDSAAFTRARSQTGAFWSGAYIRTDTLTEAGIVRRRWNFVMPSAPVKLGDVVRTSYWVRSSWDMAFSAGYEMSNSSGGYAGAGGTFTNGNLVANQWKRVTHENVITFASYAYLRSVIFNGTTSGPVGGTVDFQGLMVTINQPMPNYYCDGNSAGWKWLSNVNNSQSVGWPLRIPGFLIPPDQRSAPIKNLAQLPNPISLTSTVWVPRWYGGGGGAGVNSISSNTGVGGRTYWRKTWTAVGTNGPEDTGITVRGMSVIPGRKYTMTVRVRSSIPQKLRGFSDACISVRGAADYSSTYQAVATTSTANSITLIPNMWMTLKTSFVVPSGVNVLEAFPYVNATAGGAIPWSVGDTFDMMDLMLVEGDYDGTFSNGDTPGWRWLGTAGQSESFGWPYTLESIAGKPNGDIVGDGVQAAITGQPFDPFTVYWVYDAYAPTGEWTEPFAILGTLTSNSWSTGWATAGALSYGRRNLSDYTYSHSRLGTGPSPLDNRNGINPTQMNETRGWEYGRHVVSQNMSFPGNTDSRLLTMIDGKVDHVMSYAGGAGIGIARALIRSRTPSASANLQTPVNTNALAIRGLYFLGTHDRNTRLAIAKWLANKYGSVLV